MGKVCISVESGLCDKIFPREMQHTHTHTHTHTYLPQIESPQQTKEQNRFHQSPNWWTNKLYCFIGMLVRSYLQGQKWFKDSCTTKAHPVWVTARKSWKPGACCTACSCCGPLPHSSAVLCFFRDVWLVSESSLQLGSSESDAQWCLTVSAQGGRGLVNLVGFRNFLKWFLSCLLPALCSFPTS